MKYLILPFLVLLSPHAFAESEIGASTETLTKEDTTIGRFSQFFSLEAGRFQPRSVTIGNGDYNFQYGFDSTASALTEAGWSIRLSSLFGAGSLSLVENLGYTSFSGSAINAAKASEDLHVNVLAIDSRFRYSADWLPWQYLIPFVDGGYQYSFYNQNGGSDLESAQGGVGNLVAGAGVRLWVNRWQFNHGDFETKYSAIPFFITVRYSHIYPNNQNLDMGSDVWMGGMEIAL